jgi:plastocyanin
MKKKVIGVVWVIVAAASLAILGCSKDSSNPSGTSSSPQNQPPAQSNTVSMINIAFSPSTLTVSKGTTVTWQNNDGVTHTSTSDDGLWDTGNIAPGSSKGVTFSNAGTFKYHCTIHGPTMSGTIVVQ